MAEATTTAAGSSWKDIFGGILTGAADFHFSKEMAKVKQESNPATAGTQASQVASGYVPGNTQNVNAKPFTGEELAAYMASNNQYLGVNNWVLLGIALALFLYLLKK